MTDFTAVLLEVGSIQDYIFASNQLVQNVGASELVQQSTTDRVDACLRNLNLRSNIQTVTASGLRLTAETLDGGLDVEVVYAGGGKALLLFRSDDAAGRFIRTLTRDALEEMPGLQLLAGRERITAGAFRQGFTALHKQLFKRKNQRPRSMPLPGLAVTATDPFTGLPAAGLDDNPSLTGSDYQDYRLSQSVPPGQGSEPQPQRIAHETAAKLRAADAGKQRLRDLLSQIRDPLLPFEFVNDFDQFGDKDHFSYLAVVHTDGNGMGNRISALAGTSDRDYITNLRAFSLSVQVAAEKALTAVTRRLIDSYDPTEKTFGGAIKAQTTRNTQKIMLPFRPIVFGGDDVTFVCDGRLGLVLARLYLETFGQQRLADDALAFARAGVAVVKNHYPFSRAYALADDLAKRAKGEIDALRDLDQPSANVLDWHFAKTGWHFALDEVTQREYTAENGQPLRMRPIVLASADRQQWRTWATLETLLNAFAAGSEWADKRNKVLDLRDALRRGPTDVKLFLTRYRLGSLPTIPGYPEMELTGWQAGRCGYFDAIEALDFYVNV